MCGFIRGLGDHGTAGIREKRELREQSAPAKWPRHSARSQDLRRGYSGRRKLGLVARRTAQGQPGLLPPVLQKFRAHGRRDALSATRQRGIPARPAGESEVRHSSAKKKGRRNATSPQSSKSELQLFHRIIQRGGELIHRGFSLVAHVGETERRSLDFSVAAINQEALILNQLLQLRHFHGEATRTRSVAV